MKISVHRSQAPWQVDERLRASLQAQVVPSRLLYDSHAQAGRWLTYHEAWSPARTDEAVKGIYTSLARTVSERAPRRLVSLGAGGGQKDASIAPILGTTSYVPVETSFALGLHSARAVGLPSTEPVLLDLESAWSRDDFALEPTCFAAFGLLPNFPVESFCASLGAMLGEDDLLLISANLSPSAEPRADIVAQYDNPESRAWLEGAARELGLDRFTLELTTRSEPWGWSIDGWARLTAPQRVRLPFFDADWPEQTSLRLFRTQRLRAADAGSTIARLTGLELVARAKTDEEGVYALAVK